MASLIHSHNAERAPTDKLIPLEHVEIWHTYHGPIRIMDHRDARKAPRIYVTDGACREDWREATDEQRRLWLFELFATMNCITIIAAEEIKSEFAKIAEWHDPFITLPDGYNDNPDAFDLPRGFEPW